MKFGVHVLHAGPRADAPAIFGMASVFEELGYDSAWLFDHLINPVTTSGRYPASDDGSYPVEASFPYYEAVSVLAALAARTERIRLGTRVLVSILRPPVVLAKQLATIDAIAGGRLVLGLGTGWMPEEFEAVGVDMEHRLARLDEHTALMRGAWEGGVAEFDGQWYRHVRAGFHPQPPQPGNRIPILLGGIQDAVLRRVARWGDGWAAFSPPEPGRDSYVLMPPGLMAEKLERLRGFCDEVGRDFHELEIVVGAQFDSDPAALRAHADLGVTTCALVSFAPPGAIEERAARFASTVGIQL